MRALLAEAEGQVAEVAADDDDVHGVSHAVDVVALELEPVDGPLLGDVDGVGVLEHDALLVPLETGVELLEDVVVLEYFSELDEFNAGRQFLDDLGQDLLALPQRVPHQVHLLVLHLQPQDVEDLVAQDQILGLVVHRDRLVQPERHHLVLLLVDHYDLPVQNARVRLDRLS